MRFFLCISLTGQVVSLIPTPKPQNPKLTTQNVTQVASGEEAVVWWEEPHGTCTTMSMCVSVSKASLRRTGVLSGPISSYNGRDYVKSLWSFFTGLYS